MAIDLIKLSIIYTISLWIILLFLTGPIFFFIEAGQV